VRRVLPMRFRIGVGFVALGVECGDEVERRCCGRRATKEEPGNSFMLRGSWDRHANRK
jgi:hypothetical protein